MRAWLVAEALNVPSNLDLNLNVLTEGPWAVKRPWNDLV